MSSDPFNPEQIVAAGAATSFRRQVCLSSMRLSDAFTEGCDFRPLLDRHAESCLRYWNHRRPFRCIRSPLGQGSHCLASLMNAHIDEFFFDSPRDHSFDVANERVECSPTQSGRDHLLANDFEGTRTKGLGPSLECAASLQINCSNIYPRCRMRCCCRSWPRC